MFEFIANILAFFIKPIYEIVGNYGWTIIIFTIILKLLTMPMTIKSQKSMARMQQVQPLINEIQRKYANNREKMQQELMRVYDKYQISPTGGCMPLILQLVVMMGFIEIVYRPYTYLLGIEKSVIEGIAGKTIAQNQLSMTAEHLEKLAAKGYETHLDLSFLKFGDFAGFDLSKVLQSNMGDILMWVLPVIAVLLTILSAVVSQRQATQRQNKNAKNDAQAQQTAAMNKSMLIMMPVMTAWITYSWPLGCALYWIISTLTQMAQQFFINQFIVKKMKPIVLKKKKKKKPLPQNNMVEKEVIDVEEKTE